MNEHYFMNMNDINDILFFGTLTAIIVVLNANSMVRTLRNKKCEWQKKIHIDTS
jgi:hypothetical protein